MKQLKLEIGEITLPEAITFNYEELKKGLTEAVQEYKTLVYTPDTIKTAKADRASLNRLKSALNDERIRREKEYLAPFQDFKTKINELVGIVDNASKCVDKQVKAFEEQQKAEKLERIQEMFDAEFNEAAPWLELGQIMDPKWLNVSCSTSTIATALGDTHAKILTDLDVLSRLGDFAFEAQQKYKQTLDINAAIRMADDLKRMAAEKAAEEAARAAEETDAMANDPLISDTRTMAQDFSQFMAPPEEVITEKAEPTETEKEGSWVSFRAFLTVKDAISLRDFLEANNIEFERI